MNFQLSNVKITGLHGTKNYDIKFKDNKLILVAENGAGKTTIVNIIYYFLSKQWHKLLNYTFDTVVVVINGEELSISKSNISINQNAKFEKLVRKYPQSLRNKLLKYMRQSVDRTSSDESMFSSSIEKDLVEISLKYGLSYNDIFSLASFMRLDQRGIFEDSIKITEERLTSLVDTQILYLPTYRRIEQDLKMIVPGLEIDIEKYNQTRVFSKNINKEGYLELVEFGMEDVERRVKNKLSSLYADLNEKLKSQIVGTFLRDVINKKYKTYNFDTLINIDATAISNMLNGIDDTLLSTSEKNKLQAFVRNSHSTDIVEGEDRIIAYFISRLSTIYSELKKEEEAIIRFKDICNAYCRNKLFIYDNNKFEIIIRPISNNEIEWDKEMKFKDLSSGEKQIVSLFSHIYLSGENKFFVIIDEPELSLSVPWQKEFLPDIVNNNYCSGLLAVTHSPFIIDNELVSYASGLDMFSE